MKKGDIFVILAVLLIVAATLVFWFFGGKAGNTVAVKKNNEILYELPLNKDKTVDLKGNILVIKDGKAFIESADCKNQICVNHKPISKTGETIVCLPHKVLVEIK